MPQDAAELDLALRCLVSLQASASSVEVLVVAEERADAELSGMLALAAGELGAGFADADEPGAAAAVNVGLERARGERRDAVIVDPAVELIQAGWLERMLARTDAAGRPAAVVGARLVDGRGFLQHAGYYFSLFSREWCLRHLNGPAQLPAALEPCACPVSGRLQLIRASCLETVGLYEVAYGGAYADLDYSLRVFAAGLECIYEPSAIARWNDPAADPHAAGVTEQLAENSLRMLRRRHQDTDFSPWVPAIL
jgi:GT2 family glycosyltransferase